MALDLVLWAPTKAALATWAASNPPANPLMDAEGNTREGVSYCWWAGTGQFMTAPGVYDSEGVEVTPPTFAPGVVALLRIHSDFFANDLLEDKYDVNGNKKEQWVYSKAAKWIKDNGTPGTMGGVSYYEVGGVRLFKPEDVETFCASNNIPGHIWVGGNEY